MVSKSMRAQSPARFGTTASSRPPAVSERHTSRSTKAGSADISMRCTHSTRSTEASCSGNSAASTSAAIDGPRVGQYITP